MKNVFNIESEYFLLNHSLYIFRYRPFSHISCIFLLLLIWPTPNATFHQWMSCFILISILASCNMSRHKFKNEFYKLTLITSIFTLSFLKVTKYYLGNTFLLMIFWQHFDSMTFYNFKLTNLD